MITKSAKKAFRQNQRNRALNIRRKRKLKELIKKANVLVQEKKQDEAQKMLPEIYKALDKTAKVGVIKKNTASRKKSRITKMISKMGSAEKTEKPKKGEKEPVKTK